MNASAIKTGAVVVAADALRYHDERSKTVETIDAGTRGLIVSVERSSSGWTSVKTKFENVEHLYHCDVKAAEFSLRLDAAAKLTVKAVRAELRALEITLTSKHGEYRVHVMGWSSRTDYLTCDLRDALDTGKTIAAKRDKSIAERDERLRVERERVERETVLGARELAARFYTFAATYSKRLPASSDARIAQHDDRVTIETNTTTETCEIFTHAIARLCDDVDVSKLQYEMTFAPTIIVIRAMHVAR